MGYKKRINYYFWATYRRKLLDKLLYINSYVFKGIVLDIGGRDRGAFKKPKDKVDKWIFADININYKPDIVLDITNMKDKIDDNSIDVINTCEILEHINNVKKGLQECYRVLKKGGYMIISVPFLFPIHSDPYDVQRWTIHKWIYELKEIGFIIKKIEIMGIFFTVLGDMVKNFIKGLNFFLKYPLILLSPIIDFFVSLDNTNFIKKNIRLNKYHGGYFIIIQK